MKMRTEVIITKVNHYDMGDTRGVSCRVIGDHVVTNNSFGLDISEAQILDYAELANLKLYQDKLPARFKADFAFATVKASNGKERTGVVLSNLEYMNSVEIVDKKPEKV
jgi:hypothetical protein